MVKVLRCTKGGAAPRLARREEQEYREYLTDEQRSQAGCSAGRLQQDFYHGLLAEHRRHDAGSGMNGVLARLGVVAAVTAAAVWQRPLGGSPLGNLALGVVLSGLVLALERRLRDVDGTTLLGALVGGAIGLGAGSALGAAPFWSSVVDPPAAYLQGFLLLALTYLGLAVGARRGGSLDPARLVWPVQPTEPASADPADARIDAKILDTSVIIDGRIADICETAFVDGVIVVPQFVLKELQLVADSADVLKRNRGRRGLDILQRMQKTTGVEVRISDMDFLELREVDLKLIELARSLGGKLLTNDFNLNKIARLRGVEVLNINELANALKPVVLPGEFMNVFILKEGKEYNQGVAYLDDGTMVVVDHAREMIGKTIDVVVTSVLQTTAGKMIFGRYIESSTGSPSPERPPVLQR